MKPLKCFRASYMSFVCKGTWRSGDGIVFANTKSEALGLCLEADSKTVAEGWELEEVNTTNPRAEIYTSEY